MAHAAAVAAVAVLVEVPMEEDPTAVDSEAALAAVDSEEAPAADLVAADSAEGLIGDITEAPAFPPMGGGWRPRPRRYGGGCLGGVLSMIFVPILLVIVVLCGLFSFVGSSVSTSAAGGGVRYDEEAFQDYANEQYAEVFGRSTAYEDNLLIVFLADESHSDYYYIAWVGDHVDTEINYMLGNNSTELGQAMSACINETSYKYSLDSNLAQVMETMTQKIEALGLESSFTCDEEHIQTESRLKNNTELEMTASTVNQALTAFTDSTGIPAVIVVEDAEAVFGKTITGSSIGPVVLIAAIVILVVFLAVKLVRRRKDNADGYDSRYSDFDN